MVPNAQRSFIQKFKVGFCDNAGKRICDAATVTFKNLLNMAD